jgi:hypothetical protein
MSVISRTELLALHEKLGKQARELMAAKNHDYSTESDVFRNFRAFGTLGVLVRLSDKLARLRSFEENNKFAVSDEKLIDTILDTINYAVIYYAMKQEQAPEPPEMSLPSPINIRMSPREILDIMAPVRMTPVKVDGPYCTGCPEKNLADYYVENEGDRVYWCSNCAAEQNVDTSDMYIMDNCA